MSEHTPTPWTVWQAPEGFWTVKAVYNDEQGRRITSWPAVCNAGAQNNEANAALIVEAVNSYAANVATIARLSAALVVAREGLDIFKPELKAWGAVQSKLCTTKSGAEIWVDVEARLLRASSAPATITAALKEGK
jgi:hypothetical protein